MDNKEASKEVKAQKVENNSKTTPPSVGPQAKGGGGQDTQLKKETSKKNLDKAPASVGQKAAEKVDNALYQALIKKLAEKRKARK